MKHGVTPEGSDQRGIPELLGEHRFPRRLPALATALMCIGAIILCIDALASGPRWSSVLGVVPTLAMLAICAPLLRARTLVGPDGLAVYSGWRWKHVAWRDVDTFGGTAGTLGSPEFVIVRTIDGSTLTTQVPHRMQPELDRYRGERLSHDR